MNREQKDQSVTEIEGRFNAAKMAILTEYRGLKVGQMAELRRELFGAEGEYKVIKNTLVRIALKNGRFAVLDPLLNGPNGWVFSYQDPVRLSKALVKFAEQHEMLKIKGAVLEGEYLEPVQVKELAKMPSREELQARVLALMQAPATQLVRLIQEPVARVARLLDVVGKSAAER